MLKQLIQRLLDSRTTPSEASHSSYPDDGTITQFYPSATSVSSWTKVVDSTIAPSDGYVIVRGKATGESYVQITAGDNPPHMERSTFAKTTLNQYPILNLPIAKGKTFKVFAENTAEITVGLIKSIGGGQTLKKLILQGGVLCRLSRLYSSLRRSSWLARRSGWRISQQFLFKALLNYLLLQMGKVTLSRCRIRGLSTSEVMEFGLPILEGSVSSISDHLRVEILRSGLTLKKVKNLPTQLGNQISSLLPILKYTKSRGAIDQMFGGASC